MRMKKITSIAVAATFVLSAMVPALSFAQSVTCVPPGHPVYGQDNSTLTGCISDTAWQAAMAQQVARASDNLPTVPTGAIVRDEAGITSVCLGSGWTYLPGCVDETHTDAYRDAARSIAVETSGSGLYAYWLTH